MSGDPFTLDTNILVYSMDRNAGHRHKAARLIISSATSLACHLTLQAISEFYAVATRKQMMPTADAAQVANDMMAVFRTVPASAAAVRVALSAASAGRASYWDALLVATAAEAGCTTILTEDLADGTTLFGVRVLNPFADAALGGDGLVPAARALLSAR